MKEKNQKIFKKRLIFVFGIGIISHVCGIKL